MPHRCQSCERVISQQFRRVFGTPDVEACPACSTFRDYAGDENS